MSERHATHVARLIASVTETPGETTPELRRAIQARARRLTEDPSTIGTPAGEIPASLTTYLDTVCTRAYTVSDDDVARLTLAHSDDLLFEATVNAAVGAGVARLERAMSLLKGGR